LALAYAIDAPPLSSFGSGSTSFSARKRRVGFRPLSAAASGLALGSSPMDVGARLQQDFERFADLFVGLIAFAGRVCWLAPCRQDISG
jgi:hypothetical protein